MLEKYPKYKAQSNILKKETAYYENKNFIEAVNGEEGNAFVNRWGGEIIYDNYKIIINERAGMDRGVQILYGKNVAKDGFSEEVDMRTTVTRIVPQAYNGRMIRGERPWVDSELIGKYPAIYTELMKFPDIKMRDDANEDDAEKGIIICDTQEELEDALITRCKEQFAAGADKPTVNISVDMIALENTDEYENVKNLETVSLGDTVHCRHDKLGIVTDARVVELEYDAIKERVENVELGNYQYDYFGELSRMAARVGGAIRSDGTVAAEVVYVNTYHAHMVSGCNLDIDASNIETYVTPPSNGDSRIKFTGNYIGINTLRKTGGINTGGFGTSYATPFQAGIFCLLKILYEKKKREYTLEELEQYTYNHARPLHYNEDNVSGYGTLSALYVH